MADKISLDSALNDAAAFAEATAKDAGIAFKHSLEKLRNVGRLVTVACVDLQNPIAPGCQRFLIPTNISINHASVPGRPNNSKGWLRLRKLMQEFQGVVFAYII